MIGPLITLNQKGCTTEPIILIALFDRSVKIGAGFKKKRSAGAGQLTPGRRDKPCDQAGGGVFLNHVGLKFNRVCKIW